MAHIRKRETIKGKKRFHAQVRMAGYPARTASFSTATKAKRWATKIEAEMIDGKHFRSAEARRRTLGEAIHRYLEEEVPKKRDGSMSRVNLPWWKKKLGHLKLADITPELISEYRGVLSREPFRRADPDAKRTSLNKGEGARTFKRSNATVNRYLTALSHVFTIARKEWRWTTLNPFDAVSKLPEGRGRIRFLSDDERTRLLKATEPDTTLHLFVMAALSTAARAGELLKLRWPDVELKPANKDAKPPAPAEGRLLFRVTKNAQPRSVWLHGDALTLMLAFQDSHPAAADDDRVFRNDKGSGPYQYARVFKAACTTAEISDFKFHDLRHTAATYLARMGASEQQLRAIGGWKSGVVSRYVHLAAEDGRALLERMNKKISERG